jgi:hypothetical protein
MEGKLDKLFKDKLAQHKVNPSDDAWDQINHHLAKNRKSVWAKRFAVAAALLLLISAASIGYFYNSKINSDIPTLTQSKKIENPEINTKAEDESKTNSSEKSKPLDIPIKQSEIISESPISKGSNESRKKTNLIPKPTDSPENEGVREPRVAGKTVLPKQSEPVRDESRELLAGNISNEDIKPVEKDQELDSKEVPDSIEKPMSEKTYPKIRILYKADENSDLVVSNSKTLIDKGIKKLTEFSGEHILTDQVKTKLRNTKEDLLALNFGKIINKSNKQIEN